jgi:hypothetical protein
LPGCGRLDNNLATDQSPSFRLWKLRRLAQWLTSLTEYQVPMVTFHARMTLCVACRHECISLEQIRVLWNELAMALGTAPCIAELMGSTVVSPYRPAPLWQYARG